jgi:hypothetical protein
MSGVLLHASAAAALATPNILLGTNESVRVEGDSRIQAIEPVAAGQDRNPSRCDIRDVVPYGTWRPNQTKTFINASILLTADKRGSGQPSCVGYWRLSLNVFLSQSCRSCHSLCLEGCTTRIPCDETAQKPPVPQLPEPLPLLARAHAHLLMIPAGRSRARRRLIRGVQLAV